jgi:hypothetical protein
MKYSKIKQIIIMESLSATAFCANSPTGSTDSQDLQKL